MAASKKQHQREESVQMSYVEMFTYSDVQTALQYYSPIRL